MVLVVDKVEPIIIKKSTSTEANVLHPTYIGNASTTTSSTTLAHIFIEEERQRKRLTEFELGECRVSVCGALDPFRLVRLSIQRQSLARTLREFNAVELFFTLVL